MFLTRLGFVVVVCSLLTSARAAQPPAEQLLPTETILMVTVKDWETASNNLTKTSIGRLWNDDAMRPMRDKFNARWTNEVAATFEKDFKVKLTDYTELVRGQVSLALTTSAKEGEGPGFVLLIDSKDKGDALKTRLTELQKKWTDGGRQVKTEKIRDVEFTTYQLTRAVLQHAARSLAGTEDAAPNPEADAKKIDLLVGQSQSLLLIGTQARDLEKILGRQSGGGVPSLFEQTTFQANYNSLFRDAGIYGWLDFKPIFDQLMKPSGAVAAAAQARGVENLGQIQKVLPALGLGELKSIALKVGMGAEGFDTTLFLTAPEASRHGILKIIAPPAKDASPPPFVPADVVKFRRMRIDFQQAWTSFEGILTKIDPSIAGVVQLLLNAAGKDKDPNFDLKKSLVESLGDDLITYEKAAKNGAAPSLSLIGARNAEQLFNSLKMLIRMLPEPIGTTAMKEREFLGRKIYTLNLTPPGTPPAAARADILFAVNGGYIAYANDAAILEEYLRSSDAPPKPLRELAGFAEAAQKVGGMNSGWFSFENEIESVRATIAAETAKPKDADEQEHVTLAFGVGANSRIWPAFFDYANLPPFEQIAKYFYYTLLSASSTPEGISFKAATPTPPGLK